MLPIYVDLPVSMSDLAIAKARESKSLYVKQYLKTLRVLTQISLHK